MRIFRETKEFVCENCRTVHDLPYKRFDGKAVCDECFKELQDRVEMEIERHLNEYY
jgi:uncharacterized paraquat-inducible protein A